MNNNKRPNLIWFGDVNVDQAVAGCFVVGLQWHQSCLVADKLYEWRGIEERGERGEGGGRKRKGGVLITLVMALSSKNGGKRKHSILMRKAVDLWHLKLVGLFKFKNKSCEHVTIFVFATRGNKPEELELLRLVYRTSSFIHCCTLQDRQFTKMSCPSCSEVSQTLMKLRMPWEQRVKFKWCVAD